MALGKVASRPAIAFGILFIVAFGCGIASLYFSSLERDVEVVAPPVNENSLEFSNMGGIAQSTIPRDRTTSRLDRHAEAATECSAKMRSLGVLADRCLDIEPIVKALRQGIYIYNRPSKAYVDVPFRIVLVLKTDPSQNVDASFKKSDGPQDSVAGAFSQSVDATLHGADLGVDPAGPQLRTVTLLDKVEWEWTVTPTRAGNKTLSIEVMANLFVKQNNIPYQIRTLHSDIKISVTALQQIKDFVAAAGGTVVGLSAFASLVGLLSSFGPGPAEVVSISTTQAKRESKG